MSTKRTKPSRKPMMIVIPEELVREAPDGDREVEPGLWICRIGQVEYRSTISRKAVETGPGWKPGEALPLDHKTAIHAAHAVLRKLVRSDSDWALDDITLQRLRHSRPERWFFVIGFSRETGPSSQRGMMQICVDFNGQTGSIEKASPSRAGHGG